MTDLQEVIGNVHWRSISSGTLLTHGDTPKAPPVFKGSICDGSSQASHTLGCSARASEKGKTEQSENRFASLPGIAQRNLWQGTK